MGASKSGDYKSMLEASVKSKFKGASLLTLTAGARTGFGMGVAKSNGYHLVIVKAKSGNGLGGINLTTETNSALNRSAEKAYEVANKLGFDVEMSAADRKRLAIEKMQADIDTATLKSALRTALMGWLVNEGADNEYVGEVVQAGNSFLSGLDSTEELMTRLNDREALATWFVDHAPK